MRFLLGMKSLNVHPLPTFSTTTPTNTCGHDVKKKDPKVQSLQLRFLAVFWLLRMADWLQVSINSI
jgi:hypothetical protein